MSTRDLLTNARQRFEAARAALGTIGSMDVNKDIDTLEALADKARAESRRIAESADLTGEAKARRRAAIRRDYELAAQDIAERISDRVEKAERDQRARLRVPPPEGMDAATRMLAARYDAVLVLDRTPDDQLGRALETLARDPGDVGRLMLSDWSARYLQARRNNVAAAEFHAVRDPLAAEWLERHGVTHGREALTALQAMPEARKARDLTVFVARSTADEIAPAPAEPNVPTGPGTPEMITVQHGAHGA